LDPREFTSKLHLDRLSRCCRVAVVTDRQTDRPTVRQTTQYTASFWCCDAA